MTVNLRQKQDTIGSLIERIDALMGDEEHWPELKSLISRLEEEIAEAVMAPSSRWRIMKRHASYSEPVDWGDIVRADWPDVRAVLQEAAGLSDAGESADPEPETT